MYMLKLYTTEEISEEKQIFIFTTVVLLFRILETLVNKKTYFFGELS